MAFAKSDFANLIRAAAVWEVWEREPAEQQLHNWVEENL